MIRIREILDPDVHDRIVAALARSASAARSPQYLSGSNSTMRISWICSTTCSESQEQEQEQELEDDHRM